MLGSMASLRMKLVSMAVAAIVISACGGSGDAVGGGGGGGGGTEALATVSLPAGIPAANATISTLQTEATVTGSGQKVTVNTGTPTLSLVTETASGKLLSLGYLEPVATGQALDAKAAASALIFTALGGSNEKGADRSDLLQQISASAAATTLAGVITGQWATNPYALDNPDAALKTALDTAISQAAGAVRRPEKSAPPSDRKAEEFGTGYAVSVGMSVGGKQIFGIEGGGQYVVRNVSTVPAIALKYTGAHDGTLVDPIQPPDGRFDVPFLSEANIGQFGWVDSEIMTPQLQGNDDSTRYFDVVLTGVFGVPDPADFSEPYWANELPRWRAELESLRQKALLRIFEEVVLDFVGAGGSTFTLEQVEQTIPLLDAAGPKVHIELENAKGENGLLTTLSQLLVAAGEGDDVAKKVLSALKPVAGANAGFLDPANLSATKVKAFRAALRLYAKLGIIEPLGDYGPKLRELQTSEKFGIVSVTVSRSSLQLQPNMGEYGPGQSIPVKASVRNYDASDDVSFKWTLEIASQTTMTAGDGKTGFVIETPSDRVTLKTNGLSRGNIKLKCELFAKNEQGVKQKVDEAFAEFAQVGDMPYFFDSWPRSPGLTIFYAYSPLQKKQIGRNRYEGGNYHVELYRGDTLKARYDFQVPEYVGLPDSLATDPGTNDRKLEDPGKYVLDEGVDVFDHGDKLFLVVAKGLWLDTASQTEINQTKQTVVNGRAGTTLFAWRTGP